MNATDFQKADQFHKDGNYKDALSIYIPAYKDAESTPAELGAHIEKLYDCLKHLGRQDELDGILKYAHDLHPADWRIPYFTAKILLSVNHNGIMAEGIFHRGKQVDGMPMVNAEERDRAFSIQLLISNLHHLQSDTTASESDRSEYFKCLASTIFKNTFHVWKLQVLTDLETLPEYSEESQHPYFWKSNMSDLVPVDFDGNPVFFDTPLTWQSAKNDGERWRWAMEQAAKNGCKYEMILNYAEFLHNHLDVSNLAYIAGSQQFNLDFLHGLASLQDNETFAYLASGIQKITLPEQHSYIAMLKSIPKEAPQHIYNTACNKLGDIYCARRQYDLAVEYYSKINASDNTNETISNIVEPWCMLLPSKPQPHGRKASLSIKTRNVDTIEFRAWKINMHKLLPTMDKSNKKSTPEISDFSNPAAMIYNENHWKFQGKSKYFENNDPLVWAANIHNDDRHYDRIDTIETPLSEPGMYFIEAKVGKDHYSRQCIFIESARLVSTHFKDGSLYCQLLDSVSGTPIPNTPVNIYVWSDKAKNNYAEFTFHTKENGEIQISKSNFPERLNQKDQNYFTLILEACLTDGSNSILQAYLNNYNRRNENIDYRSYGITDRPAYHPGDTVNIRIWQTKATFPSDSTNIFASSKKSFQCQILDPQWNETLNENFNSDETGAISIQWKIPDNATLGRYHFGTKDHCQYSFRVEEYRKPEFEASIETPEKPLVLGSSTVLKLKAKYYFGMPVSDANVHLTINRQAHNLEWWPIRPWDWYYGNGYIFRHHSHLPFPRYASRKELISETDASIGEDGTLEIHLDTAKAAELFPDSDHDYSITAEIRDKSRRTITATASVIAARAPYKLFLTVDKGFYYAGERVNIQAFARRADSVSVDGNAIFKLDKLQYLKNGTVKETPITQTGANSKQGCASADFTAAEPGQYRITCLWKDNDDNEIQNSTVITVRSLNIAGEISDRDFKFNSLEITTDKLEYTPGDTAKIAISTDRINSTVMLFIKPENGYAQEPPMIINLNSRSAIVELPISENDMPNFFLEAYTFADGELHNITHEIIVPPANKILDVKISDLPQNIRPGETASFEVKIKDFQLQTPNAFLTVALYDRAVDAIAPECIPPDIRRSFWQWDRNHYSMIHSPRWYFANMLGNKEPFMQTIGAFEQFFVNMQLAEDDETEFEVGTVEEAMDFATGAKPMEFGSAPKPAPQAMRMAAKSANGVVMEKAMASADYGMGYDSPAQTVMRKDFADTAYWNAKIPIETNGTAKFSIKLPDNLTDWKLNVWAVTPDSRVGFATAGFTTSKNIMVRLESPRFFIENDEVIVSAIVNNKFDTQENIIVSLDLPDDSLILLNAPKQFITVQPNQDKRVDWKLKVVKPGTPMLRVFAESSRESDAMEQSFTAYVHGIPKQIPSSAILQDGIFEKSINFTVPQEIRENSASVTLRYSPSLAMSMLDAIPYLLDYPYGCTEQTLNRFLPAVIVKNTINQLGISLDDIKSHANNLNAQELDAADTRTKQWKRLENNPIFDDGELEKIIAKGIADLQAMQCSDGGWGWFSGSSEHSWPHTTATVVRGFITARNNGLAIPANILDRGINWLKDYQKEQLKLINDEKEPKSMPSQIDAMIFCILSEAGERCASNPDMHQMNELLFNAKAELAIYPLALYALALHLNGDLEKRNAVMKNLSQYITADFENQTAFIHQPSNDFWWFWYGDDIEANAAYLRLLIAVNPKDRLAPLMVKYLLNNRKHCTYWNSTRDTALCLQAFAEFIAATGENSPDMTIFVLLDGKPVGEQQITADNLFTFDNELVLNDIKPGFHSLTIRRSGTGPVYINSYLKYFDMQSVIPEAGLELKISRKLFKITANNTTVNTRNHLGQPITQTVRNETKTPIKEDEPLAPGDVIEVQLFITSKNDYEYILIEDFKPAGAEPDFPFSGYNGNSLGAYMEYRTNKVAMMLRTLRRGNSMLSYRLRAETPGSFHALPTIITGMYAPELQGNSKEILLKIEDSQQSTRK